MVRSVTSLGRSGLHDWIIQRVSAVVLLAYVIYLSVFIFSQDNIQFEVWRALFQQTAFKLFSFMALASICFHAWVGLWVVSTDYLTSQSLPAALKPTAVRMVFQVSVILLCVAFLLWGTQILWSV